MADRFFPNEMPDFVSESDTTDPLLEGQEEETGLGGCSRDSLTKLLHMPYRAVAERLKRAALDLKETVVIKTWGTSGQRVEDYTLYSGTLGTAFLLFKSYQVTGNKEDLHLCSEIVKACNNAYRGSEDATFICGRAGICALGAVAANTAGDRHLYDYYLTEFTAIRCPKDLTDELLYGKVGFLWACSFLNKNIGDGTISSASIRAIASDIIVDGRRKCSKGGCPLMFEWHGEKYWGAAHGLAGIVHVLMMNKYLKPDEIEDIKGTLRYMIKNRLRSGNYRTSEDDKFDIRVHWCHGAPGVALTLVKAAEVLNLGISGNDQLQRIIAFNGNIDLQSGDEFAASTSNGTLLFKIFGDSEFLEAAIEAVKIVWQRGLLKHVGICHGISGNAYVFLALYRLTGNLEFLYKAKAFACFLLDRAHRLISEKKMHGGDAPYSMFEGIGGMAYIFLDMINPQEARFPAYEL